MKETENHVFGYKVFCNEKTSMYGIYFEDENENKNEAIEDITAEKDVAEKFCEMLNSAEIHPYHFHDVYEDFFG
ncbi:MAG: hypothetical protein E7555_09505 [Ruminococcaceae bacterium]|nr:hypothetical protein [Oscillospiraceae bacterium]